MSIFNVLLRPISKIEMERKRADEGLSSAESTATEVTPAAEDKAETTPVVDEAIPAVGETIPAVDEAVPMGEETIGEVAPVADTDEAVPAEEAPKQAKETTVFSYFHSKGMSIDVSNSNNSFAPVEGLSLLLASNYDKCKDFYKYIRGMISKKRMDFCYNTHHLSTEQRDATYAVAEALGNYGVISNLRISFNSKEIIGKLSSAPRVINFINGDYLEFYSRSVVKQVVERIAKERGCSYEILSNVIVEKDLEKHELDIVFRVGDHVFWAEIKSGKFSDFDCYRKLGILMNVNPDKHILLSAEKTTDEAETISWFYQFYVSNIRMFKEKLVEMIERAFEEE